MSAWLGWLDAPPGEGVSLIVTTASGVLGVWRSEPERPHPAARRLDPRVLDPDGDACWVSLVWPCWKEMPLFDDPAVLSARRDVLSGPTARAFSTMVVDSTRYAGSVWVVDHPHALEDDPFRRLGPHWSLGVPAGWFGRTPRPCGPAVERYAGAPWPDDGAPLLDRRIPQEHVGERRVGPHA